MTDPLVIVWLSALTVIIGINLFENAKQRQAISDIVRDTRLEEIREWSRD